MEFAIYYTLGGIVLYSAADWIMNSFEQSRGKRLPHRNIIFFIIFFIMAYFLMNIINPPPDPQLKTPETTTPSQ